MADWQQALEILSDAPQLPAGDATAQQSARLQHALDARLRATTAVSAHARDKKLAAAAASLSCLGVAQKQAAVAEVIRHFSALNARRGAVEDAMRPLPGGSVLWADPALHGQINGLLTAMEKVGEAVGERVGDVDWAARFSPEKRVVEARYAEAAEAYSCLNESFKKMCAARDAMIGVERKHGGGADDEIANDEKGEVMDGEESVEKKQTGDGDDEKCQDGEERLEEYECEDEEQKVEETERGESERGESKSDAQVLDGDRSEKTEEE